MTYSIVALDRATGELGVAVQTRWFAVGAICPWVEPGVGAVATQSFVEPAYGPRTLALLRDGVSPADALERQLAADEGRGCARWGSSVRPDGRPCTPARAAWPPRCMRSATR
jgi:uncharacterized Ntn-hydrolase superfamily protein